MTDVNEAILNWPNQVRSVNCTHNSSSKVYSYVSEIAVKPGDFVLVENQLGISYAKVQSVYPNCRVRPGESTKYAWILGVVTEEQVRAHRQKMRDVEAILAANRLQASTKRPPAKGFPWPADGIEQQRTGHLINARSELDDPNDYH